MSLKNTTAQGLGALASYASATLLFTIPAGARPPAQATFKNLGTVGFWYIQFQRDVIGSGPSTTVYSLKLAPGEEFTEDNPPKGTVFALAGGTANGDLSYYSGWLT